ncbi:MAG TPA: FAD-dependent oxidoreductase [Aquabacterium sp.]|uniref:FAD-dependent oxidoreductase n=1 Tax=Aquabacterium sp. TaxID=1872578 RepID=UPI002E37730A|nr:FAD-dependent oxidoreductase [Aquabacterium sp.]HEX5371308.1 FAD-dependent oxidoreductase [Aquabacterium sp.]
MPGRARRAVLQGALAMAGAAVLPACRPREALYVAGQRLPAHITGGWVGPQIDRGHAARDGRWPVASAGMPVRRVHTLVMGAGVAGLSAARTLMQGGLDDIAVLDLEDHCGGAARGHELAGLPCPLGAHYLPVPGEDARDVAQWLEEIGLIRREQGRWRGDERHLCHSPQERLFLPELAPVPVDELWRGHWQDGLLPLPSRGSAAWQQMQAFSREIEALRQSAGFAMPTTSRPWNTALAALDGQTFAQWLDARGYTDPALRWVLDYACRDDYGAQLTRVSAWAGIHYFASRHGFEMPGAAHEDHDAVLTWPQGNAWLVQRLSASLADRWQGGTVVLRVQAGRREVVVDTWSVARQQAQRWVAREAIMATPLFMSARLLHPVPAPLQALRPLLHQAPWLVSNVLLDEAPHARPGAPLSWDNVVYTSQGVGTVDTPSLGYVDARHQSLAPVTGPTVWTHYWALGGRSTAMGLAHRQQLLSQPWSHWASLVLADLARVQPDIVARVRQMDLMRWGHGMVIPVPGLRGHPALAALQQPQGRLHFAHSDLSAYSVFEEAFTHGVRAARQVLASTGLPRRKV